ncbi:MAG TPA: SDR family NAD(P)-dependent oxidoreductase [Pirellulales bacterium]|nr:SDR family NAD(P)-dependent oxidoreductase [Pirellulales bacterium]
MRRDLTHCRVLITGASSGIGAALAVELARAKANIVLNGRREDRLREVAEKVETLGGQAVVAPGDVTEKAVRIAALELAERQFGGLDVLVNNAGVSAWGIFHEASEDRLRRIMDVNFFAPAELMREAAPLLQRGRSPLIVNVASILGHRGIPLQAEYCASKFALRGLSEAIRPELRRLGIDLLVASPGTTESDFFEHLLERAAKMPWRQHRGMPVATVARQVVRAMWQGRHEIVLGGRGKLLVWLNRLAPRLLDTWMERYTR